jgi:hypothetical protein
VIARAILQVYQCPTSRISVAFRLANCTQRDALRGMHRLTLNAKGIAWWPTSVYGIGQRNRSKEFVSEVVSRVDQPNYHASFPLNSSL